MSKNNRLVKGLICRECGRSYPKEPLHICEYCFGPLEVDYDYKAIASSFTAETIKNRYTDIWRYRELLPIDKEPTVGLKVGYTHLSKPIIWQKF